MCAIISEVLSTRRGFFVNVDYNVIIDYFEMRKAIEQSQKHKNM